jgi:zinc protease
MNYAAVSAAALAAALLSTTAADAQSRRAAPARASAAPAAAAIPVPDIPYTKYVLKNGLTLIVHEDRKAPIVAVNVWYHVGSKNEPKGRSGFAHLFEHLMFNGSENFNQDYFNVVERIGATDLNGTTNLDRTNYFQNVPKGALDTILWLESDRMGHLLGAIDQARLDEQRGVVQNEKRQGENQPYGRAFNHITRATYPEEHPYGHTVIGEMADLNAASLEDVREWFRAWYGPSNAVIVLAGDITPEEAKAKVERYFGDIPPGAPVAQPKRWIAKRTGAQREVMEDRVAQPRLYKVWNVPEMGSEDSDRLSMVADLLSSGRSSRLYKRLVYDDQTATGVSASNGRGELGSRFTVTVTAKPGQDLRAIEKVVDEEMARLFRDGPTAAELERVRTENLGSLIRGFERIGGFGGKSDLLAASEVYMGSPDAWKTTVERFRTTTAAQLRDVGREWLTDGSYTLEVVPFGAYAAVATGVDRKTMPQPGQIAAPAFPAFQRATLSNGLKVIVVPRRDAPVVNFNLLVEAGNAANPVGKPGTALLASNVLTQGTQRRDALQISDELMMLGATLNAGNTSDATSVGMNTLKATLDRSLALYADVIQNPAFRESDVERQRRLQLPASPRRSARPARRRSGCSRQRSTGPITPTPRRRAGPRPRSLPSPAPTHPVPPGLVQAQPGHSGRRGRHHAGGDPAQARNGVRRLATRRRPDARGHRPAGAGPAHGLHHRPARRSADADHRGCDRAAEVQP